MQEGYCCWTLILYIVLVFGCSQQKFSCCHARKIQVDKEVFGSNRHVDMEELQGDDEDVQRNKKHLHPLDFSSHSPVDPSLNVFFTPSDLKAGKILPIFFPIKNHSQNPKLLPKEIADSIPFSVSNLSHLLEFFSITKDSPQAKAMEYTLRQCELEPMRGEAKFCATSLESLLDSTRGVFGSGTQMKAMTTSYPRNFKTQLQTYTILKEPGKIWSPKILSCHSMPYPYMVFYCHSQTSDNMLYEVSLGAEDGDRVEATAICHLDTSQWDREHVVFKVLNVEPGASSVCHFYPADNIAWIPLSANSLG